MADQAVDRYLRKLDSLRDEPEATPELSLREPLLELVRTFGRDLGRSKLTIAPEASAGDIGQPDIFVKDGPRLIGFVETKAPDAQLSRLLKTTKQLKSYAESLPNWVLTDYYVFIFIQNGVVGSPIDARTHPDELRERFGQFFDSAPRNIRSASRLAEEMARRSRLLKSGLLGALKAEHPGGQLKITLEFYRKHLMDDLSDDGFADTFAQTAVYGMFLGWLRWSEARSAAADEENDNGDGATFTRRRAVAEIPDSVPFLRSSLRLLTSDEILPPAVLRLLDDLAALFDNTVAAPIAAEIAAIGVSQRHDPMLYFYEKFLEKYDAGERQKRGVYYTPAELVSYIVTATQALLQTQFGHEDGLADPNVIVLDPAVGTGTFLIGAAAKALSVVEPQGSAATKRLIREHLLPDFYGFELLPAPYAVAHLKIGSFYGQHKYKLSKTDRARVYLSNTLHKDEHATGELQPLPIFSAITDEAMAAAKVKHQVPVLVVLGNPPYERTSHNSNKWADQLQQAFYRIDGVEIKDKNPAPLKDDYLRFIRWSVWKLLEQGDGTGGGILAFVTNRAFIERVLHRGVRKFLLDRFDEIYVYDLHGDQREWYRGRVDEKVFKEVQAGIAVTVMVKRPGLREAGLAHVRYREAWGTREDKLGEIAAATLTDAAWTDVTPESPYWLLVPSDSQAAYKNWPSVKQLFPLNVSGVQTHRDQLVVADTEAALRKRLEQFANPNVPDSYWEQQDVKTTKSGWDLKKARALLKAEGPRQVRRWTFRGLERRWVAFDERLIDRTRTNVSPHLLADDTNIALAFGNGSLTDGPYAVVSRGPMPAAVLSHRTIGAAYMAPLWLHGSLSTTPDANVAPGLLGALQGQGIEVTPEGLLHYVYAVLNSPWFRQTYADGLRRGFAHIPFARDSQVFADLQRLGGQLVSLHLFEHQDIRKHSPRMDGDDTAVLTAPKFSAETQTLHLSDTLTATSVTPEMWDYQQGSYRVLRDYLDERQGRALDSGEFDDFRSLVAVVKLTLERLPAIDALVEQAAADSLTVDDLGLPVDGAE